MQSVGKKVRYIGTAVFPTDARGLCLLGAEEPRWIHEVNEAAGIPSSRTARTVGELLSRFPGRRDDLAKR